MADVNWLITQPERCYFYPERDCPGWELPHQSCWGRCLRIGNLIPVKEPEMIYHGKMDGLSDYAPNVVKAAIGLGPHQYDFDTIVCTGISGLLFGAPLSLIFGKHLVVIRKPEEFAHSTMHPGMRDITPTARWIFIDDFIGTGSTWRKCRDAMQEKRPDSVCVGRWTERDGWESKEMIYGA